jgi:hypothetical protein
MLVATERSEATHGSNKLIDLIIPEFDPPCMAASNPGIH